MVSQKSSTTVRTKRAVYFSRSRQTLWHKGATSGLIQKVREMRVDDDQDAIWLRVEVTGGASCHVGYRSCFYRRVPVGEEVAGKVDQPLSLQFMEDGKVFDPTKVYGDAPNPTQL